MGQLTFQATLGGSVNLAGPNTASTTTFTLPSADGTSGQALTTNGSGTLAFATVVASAATPTALGTVYGKQTTVGGTPFLTAIGYDAGGSTTGVGVSAFGVAALYTNSTGARNTAMGYQAGYTNNGDRNLFLGYQVGYSNTTGTGNSFVGGSDSSNWPAAYSNTTGSDNSAFGGGALRTNSTGSANVAVGTDALYSMTGGNSTAVGFQALYTNSSGTDLTAVGRQALFSNTTGYSNSAFGIYALYSNTTAIQNTAVGREALYSNTTSSNHTAVGHQSLYNNTSGANNTAVGYRALENNSTGDNSVALGAEAGKEATTGGYNTFIGRAAGLTCTTGVSNTIVGGYAASNTLTTGSRNTYLGYGLTPSGAAVTEEIIIAGGGGGTGKGSSTGYINPATGGVYQGNNSATWSVASDRRLKKSIVDNNIGLEKITQIQVRNFEYRLPEEVTELPQNQAIEKIGVQLGVIAQELQVVLPDCIKTESTGVMTVNSDNLTWYMINAIKELKTEFDAYKASHP